MSAITAPVPVNPAPAVELRQGNNWGWADRGNLFVAGKPVCDDSWQIQAMKHQR